MKNIMLLMMLVISKIAAQQPQNAVTFAVCPVEKATLPLPVAPWEEVATKAINLDTRNQKAWHDYLQSDSTLDAKSRSKLYSHKSCPQLVKVEAKSKNNRLLVNTKGANALVVAAAEAYAGHRPLVLSPDMIWLTILQGVGAHVAADPERLRHHFVDFQGEKALEVWRLGWRKGNPDNPWENVFAEFHDKIRDSARVGVVETLLPRFSTTGIVEQAAMDVTLMHTLDDYFDYRVYFVCGIPEITLEGTSEDWALIEKHAAQLTAYELDWWVTSLLPILHEFTEAANGRANAEFWNNMIMRRQLGLGCATKPYLTGWVIQLFPYLDGKRNPWVSDSEAVKRYQVVYDNHQAEILAGKSAHRESVSAPRKFGLPDLNTSSFPSSMAKANVLLNDYGTKYNLEFLAGFAGIRQDEKTLALRPEIGWVILDTGLKDKESAAKLYRDVAKKILIEGE